ncbi:ricin B lectin domain-containing protein [Mycena sanguinolenta]|nr:ricin B lectin domain-containing protein [Mycena sanguinolenta]
MFSPVLLASLFSFALLASADQILSAVDSGICITAAENADGAPLVVQPCSAIASPNQEWKVSFFSEESSVPAPMVVLGDKCIDVTNGVDADGTPLQVWTCVDGSTNQQWISVTDNTFQWSGTDKCIDLTNGNTANNTVLQIWTCEDNINRNQEWFKADTSLVEIIASDGSGQFCIASASDDDGAAVTLVECDDYTATYPNGNIVFDVPAQSGSITGFGKCLDVTNGVNADGTKLQLWSCVAGNTNQMFTSLLSGQIEWAGTGKCLDATNGQFTTGTPIQVWDCAAGGSNQNQQWDLQELAFV